MAVVNNNLSSIVGFQLTNSFRNENPQFVKFLESYYQFLESIQLHFETSNGVFTEGETVTGSTSGATAKILSIDTSETLGSGTFLYVSQTNNVIFQKMENVIGETGGNGTLHHYRRNPLNAVKMVFDWDDINSPNNDMIYNFRHELFENFPEDLQIDKSLFVKHIKELYLEKGDERSYQTLFRMAYGTENLEFYYPKTDILKPSHGQWIRNVTLQVTQTPENYNFLANRISGVTSEATAFVEELALKKVSTVNVLELYLKNIIGSFEVGETIRTIRPDNISANTNYTATTTTALGIISTDPTQNTVTMTTEGNGYVVDQTLSLSQTEGVGASLKIGSTTNDQVVFVNALTNQEGTGYQVGDKIDFDNTIANPTISAMAEIEAIGDTSIVSVNDDPIFQLTNTHVMTLSTNTDIPIRNGFLLSNYQIYDNDTYSTKRGIVVDAISNTVIRYALTKGSLFNTNDIVNAFKEDGFAFTPTLNSAVSHTSTAFSNDITIGNPNYGSNGANTNFAPTFTSKTSTSTLNDSFSFSNKTVGSIQSIKVTRFGDGYNSTPTLSVKTNSNYQQINQNVHDGLGTIGNDAVVSVNSMGGGITSVSVENPGAAFGTSIPTIDFTPFGDGTANGTIRMDAVRFYEGFYKGADGQLSSQKKIQDSKYYQDFSYVIQSDTSIERYKDLVLNTIHPGGMELFGEVILRNNLNAVMMNKGVSDINSVNPDGSAVYRSLLRQIVINTDVEHASLVSDLEVETETETYIDGILLKSGTTSTVASNRIETDQVKKENSIQKTHPSIRFWSDMQKHTWSSAIETKYQITYYDLNDVSIAGTANTVNLVKSYEPGTLIIYIDDELVDHFSIDQADGNDFTIPITPAEIHSEQIKVIESYVKITLDDYYDGHAYLNDDDYVYLQDESSDTFTPDTHTFADQVYNQKFKVKLSQNYNSNRNIVLLQEDGRPLRNNFTSYSSSQGSVFRMSKDLWSVSQINMLKNEKVGYYHDRPISDYNFEQTINNLTDVYSSGNDIFIDRKYLSLDEELLMEDGTIIETEITNVTLSSEGSVSKYETEWRLFEEDYQFHTINSVSTNKLTLNQFVNWELNKDINRWTFSLENISAMNRT